MGLTDSEFMITVLPTDPVRATSGMHLSLCVDINGGSAPTEADAFREWFARIAAYHASAKEDSLHEEVVERALTAKAYTITGRTVKRVERLTPPVASEAIRLWNQLFQLGTGTHAYPSITAPRSIAPPHNKIVWEAPLSSKRSAKSVQDAIAGMLREGPHAGTRTLLSTEAAAISQAATESVHWESKRLKKAFETRGDLNKVRAIAERSRSVDDMAAGTAALFQLQAEQFTNSVEYAQQLFNVLSGSPQLRRAFGTTVDVFLELDEPLSDNESAVVKFTPGSTRFCCVGTYLKQLPVSDGGRLIVDDGNVGQLLRNGVLQLSTAHVLSFEPQSAAAAVEDAAREVASESQSMLTASVPDCAEITRTLSEVRDARALADGAAAASTAKARLDSLRHMAARTQLLTGVDKRCSNLQTRGLVVYHPDALALANALDTEDEKTDTSGAPITCSGAIRGFVVFARSAGTGSWASLTRIRESLDWKDGKDWPLCEFELGIHVGGAVQAADSTPPKADAPTPTYPFRDGFVFAWDGVGLSAQSPLRQRERGSGATVEDDHRLAIEENDRVAVLNRSEVMAAQQRAKTLVRIDWWPFASRSRRKTDLTVRRMHALPSAAGVKLAFAADEYEFLVVAQYHNGYVPLDLETLNRLSAPPAGATPRRALTRHDHIRDIIVALEEDIFADGGRKQLKRQHAGEAEAHLVVRTGELLVTDSCTRMLLPPPIPTFQTYLWYRAEELEKMGPPRSADSRRRQSRVLNAIEVAAWYERYSCDARSVVEFQENALRDAARHTLFERTGAVAKGCARGCSRFCGGLSQPSVWDGKLRYLPDPAVTGLRLEFFTDEKCYIAADGYKPISCFYRAGSFPDLVPWQLILVKGESGENARTNALVDIDEDRQAVRIAVAPGRTIWVKITPIHDAKRAGFSQGLLQQQAMSGVVDIVRVFEGTDDVADALHANVRVLALTHALQRPLVTPTITKPRMRRVNPQASTADGQPPKATMFELDVDVTMEWLNAVYGIADADTAPTGQLDLFALWDDFDERHDGPSVPMHAKPDTRTASGRFVKVASLRRDDFAVVSKRLSGTRLLAESDRSTIKLTFRAEHAPFTTAQHVPIRFRVRSTSKFRSFFHLGTELSDEDVESHSWWSNELSSEDGDVITQSATIIVAPFMPANLKPESPQLRKIVGLIARDDRGSDLTYRGDRVRLYFSTKGRQKTGPDRIGVLVSNGVTGGAGLFATRMSQAGRDIVTDGLGTAPPVSAESWLQAGALVRSGLEPEYEQQFRPQFHVQPLLGLAPGVGVVSYKPRFDDETSLWYVDIVLDLRAGGTNELHNAFARLALVTYQPYGANYGQATRDVGAPARLPFEEDLRFSEPVLSDFFSIYPSRTVERPYVLFGKHDGQRCVLSGDLSSLYVRRVDGKSELRTQFFAEVQRCDDIGTWQTIDSSLSALEVLFGGQRVPNNLQHAVGAYGRRHLLLPAHINASHTQRFECAFDLSFKTKGWLDSPRSGRYRVVVREIDWYPRGDSVAKSWEEIQVAAASVDLAQLPDVHTRQIMILTPR